MSDKHVMGASIVVLKSENGKSKSNSRIVKHLLREEVQCKMSFKKYVFN